jgi:hypothetical protein
MPQGLRAPLLANNMFRFKRNRSSGYDSFDVSTLAEFIVSIYRLGIKGELLWLGAVVVRDGAAHCYPAVLPQAFCVILLIPQYYLM